MATADRLLELLFSWMEQRERCAEQLRKLAGELEALREKCNASECIGSTVSVLGAACLIGAGVATVFTGGAAAPFLGVLGAAYSGVGVTISVVTKITEHFLSSDTMKEAQNTEQKSNDIGEEIQRLFRQLKAERKEAGCFADPDEVDRHIMTEILRAAARRSGLQWNIKVNMLDDEPQFFINEGHTRLNLIFFKPEVIVGLAAILTFFTFKVSGKKFKLLFAKGAETLIKQVSTTGFKSVLKGGAMVVGGAVGMAFALPEAIDNWKESIKKNHVTEASKSLRDTADAILKITRTLRQQFNDMKKMFDEMAKSQREQEEKLSREKTKRQDGNQETKTGNRDAQETSGNQQTGSDQHEEGGDQQGGGGQDSDSEEEENSQDEEESSSDVETEEDESKQTGKKKKKRHRKRRKQRGPRKEVTNQSQDSRTSQAPRPPATILVALLNIWSMNNKRSIILQLIMENQLDVLLTTETFLQEDTGDAILREASPPNYCFHHQARDGRGGGAAVQFLQDLQGERILFESTITTFECVAVALQHDEWDKPVLFINVYHPPRYNLTQLRTFLNELQTLLNEVSEDFDSIVVTGDFNIWIDYKRRSAADEFEWFLLINDLVQHVQEPTQRAGHILDLVITRNVEISCLFVRDDGISDHSTIYFNIRPNTTDEAEEDEQVKQFKKQEE